MIRPPSGFTVRREGAAYIFESADRACTLRYVERLRPVPTIEALWGADFPSVTPPRRFVTDEGEYAWILDGVSAHTDTFAGRVLGAVVGDDFLAVLEARSTTLDVHRAAIALVEQLLRADDHLLGIRRRPYWHTAPDGWDVEAGEPFYVTYRRGGSALHVSPAIPLRLADRDAVVASLQLPAETVAEPVTSPMRGTRWSGVGDACVEAFVLEDDEYLYAALAVCPARSIAEVEAALTTLMTSVEPIPRARPRAPHRPLDGAFRRAIAAAM